MKNIKQLLIIALAITLMMPACRKGEDDPGLSLRSRDARLVGEWNINEYNHSRVSSKIAEDFATGVRYDTTTTINTDFDGTTFRYNIQVVADQGGYNEMDFYMDSTTYTYTLTFEENGKFRLAKTGVTTEFLDVEIIRAGNWSWGNADKKKVMLHLNFQGNVETFYVRELRKDVLNMERIWNEYDEFESYDPFSGRVFFNTESISNEEDYSMDKKD